MCCRRPSRAARGFRQCAIAAVPALKMRRAVLDEGAESLFAAGVADMDFKAPPPVLAAM